MLAVRRLVWDGFNVPHIARHSVTPDEVEEVCQGAYIVRQAYAGRIMLTGPTARLQMLAVILEPESDAGVYYPVMARPASRKERAMYDRERSRGNGP
jgi:hypothetical protein